MSGKDQGVKEGIGVQQSEGGSGGGLGSRRELGMQEGIEASGRGLGPRGGWSFRGLKGARILGGS